MVKLAPSSSPRLLLLLLLLALPLTTGSVGNVALPDGPDITKCDDSNGTYTSGSTYQQNLNTLFTKMTTSDIRFGFYNSSLGQAPDVVYLIALCLGNFPITDCRACLSGIVEQIDILCPNQKNAVLWSGTCMLRYSKYPMIGKLEESPYGALGRGIYFSNVTEYIQVVRNLLRSLPSRAAAGNSSIKFAYAQADYNSYVTIYSAAQCTPDLTHQDCLQCLNDAIVGIETESSGQRGARFNFPSCYVRYEEGMFYWLPGAPPPVSSPPASSPSSTKGTRSSKRTRKIIVAAAVAGSLCVLLIASFIYICIRKRELYQNLLHINKFIDGDDISKSLQFKFSTTRAATGNFSEDNKLGQGGFGAVYKGTLPDSGQEIAVKRLAGNSSQGEAEFKNEIKLLAKLQHKNLVRLLGFCFHNKERLLIYEFVPNASLDHFLFEFQEFARWE